ncbi:MAG: glutamine synthetase family protein [Candidatus Thermoplasmatota archaeon]|nr:glutamine synthetase [Euryarchaeota archaeon]MBU4032414.1 glutamine synthetase family protein [Candidatus Thermoplasmatota archaeon]MBU4071826.1 glutamine synthetase family protein [Candidatus Thermoplasmatota archaeon]MBU4144969.1 glutamine synthetase family protein [Candidatus Thermoplasmatota archaeon]MBU4592480.1 glutamine synthetase family protein [Candidatus Thermoplasmatota archaeon]
MSEEHKKVNELIKKKNIRWVVLNFLDISGEQRCISLPASSFTEGNAWHGTDCDGSSVGFMTLEKSDMLLIPDPSSAWIDPFFKDRTLNVHASTSTPDGVLMGPRSGLTRMLKEYDKLGFVPLISPEMEFSLYESIQQAIIDNDVMGADMDWAGKNVIHSFFGFYDGASHPHRPKKAYLSSNINEDRREYRNDLSNLLTDIGYEIRYHHHEGGKRQLEIETGYFPAMKAADFIANFKYLARGLGKQHCLIPTFMAKPSAYDAGNGMHFHIRLMKGKQNAFSDKKGELNETAMQFIAGLMKHAPAICSFTNPTINSYRRLMPGFQAPTAISWSRSNRTALIRVPASAKGPINNVEIRNPDPSANPYLATTALLAAGLDGIKKKMKVPPESKGNLYKKNNLESLPSSLEDALVATAKDSVIVNAIGADLFESFKAIKSKELSDYRKHVPIWDFNVYFNV